MARVARGVAYAGPACPRCGAALSWSSPGESLGQAELQHCRACRGDFQAARFLAPLRSAHVIAVGESLDGAETPCAAHAGNAATANCQRCGVFMCDLCRIDVDSQQLCPACFERLSAEGALASTRTKFRDYARQSMMLGAVGVFMWFAAVAIGPFAVYSGVRALRDRRRRGEEGGAWAAWVGILLGLLETTGGAALLYFIFARGH